MYFVLHTEAYFVIFGVQKLYLHMLIDIAHLHLDYIMMGYISYFMLKVYAQWRSKPGVQTSLLDLRRNE